MELLTTDEAKLLLTITDEKITQTHNELLLQMLKELKEKIKNIICYGNNEN